MPDIIQSLPRALMWVCLSSLAVAAEAEQKPFDIPASMASVSIPRFAGQAGVQIIAPGEQLTGVETPAVHGLYEPADALAALIVDTGLVVVAHDDRTVTLAVRPESQQPGATRSAGADQQSPPEEKSAEQTGQPASGQARPDPDDGTTDLEQVVVTGSRIHRTELVTATPMTVFDRTDISTSGRVELSEILLEIPSVASSISTTSSQLSTQNAGLSIVDLRNLGAERSLVLIDGRRTVSNSANVSQVSLSTIPVDFVERIEVITGGASAVYGSDAIAGVINIITRKDFQGARITARGGTSTRGDAEELTFSTTLGTDFADGRGNVMVSLTYDEDFGLKATDRKRARRSVRFDDDDNVLDAPNFSTFVPGGRFEGSRFFFDEQGLQTGFVTDEDGFDLRPFNALRIDRERLLFAGKGEYWYRPNLGLFAHAQFSSVETDSSRAAVDLSNTSAGFTIPLDNPFIPDEILANAIDRNQSGIDFRRRMSEIGLRGNLNDRDTIRVWTGLMGSIASRWDWEVSLGYGNYDQSQVRTNDVNLLFLREALNAEPDPNNPGQFRCRDELARDAGCVPINLFGVGSITPEAANFARLDALFDVELEQIVTQGHLTGELFRMPGGMSQFAVGFEYRDEEATARSDPISEAGFARQAAIPGLKGSFDVTEGFAEVILPLIADRPGFHRLGLEGAFRIADYSQPNVDTVSSWKVGLDWAPTEDIRLRGQFSRAQRAPSILELFSPARDNFTDIIDPCDGVTADTAGGIAENCRTNPGIAAQIAEFGVFEQDGLVTFAPNLGNINLAEETADTWTGGIVLTPRWIPGLGITADYYNIEVEDAIGGRGAQEIVDQCFGDPNSFPNNIFCDEISRDADGELSRINNVSLNLDRIETEGIDVAARYPFELPGSVPGRFEARVLYTHVFTLQRAFPGLIGETAVDDNLGEVGTPEDRARFTLRWNHNGWHARWRTNFTGETVDSNDRKRFFRERGIDDPLFLNIDREITHDLYLSWTVDAARAGMGLELFAGINNVFDNIGPFLPSGTIAGRNSNFSGQFDIIGRSVFGGLRLEL